MRALQVLSERAIVHAQYFTLRAEHPTAKPATCLSYARGDHDPTNATFEQHQCAVERGHGFTYTGTQYGGDDDRWSGEGRCLCAYCGADGDA